MSRVRMIAFLLIFGGAVFGVLGALHAVYTLLDLRNPRRLVPADPSVSETHRNLQATLTTSGLFFAGQCVIALEEIVLAIPTD
jgi:hypothetical protein